MTFWIILTIVIAAASALLFAPLLRQNSGRRALARELDVYRDQLEELERRAAEAVIDAAQAARAGREIRRRMLIEKRARTTGTPRPSLSEGRLAMASIAGLVMLGSVGIYLLTGGPELPSADASIGGAGGQGSNAVEQLAAFAH